MTNSSQLDDDAGSKLDTLKMRLIVTFTAAICLGIHALFGCCWHGIWGESATVVSANAGVHCHHHCDHCCDSDSFHHGNSEKQHDHSHCPCNSQCRGTCNYLPTVKVEHQQLEIAGFVIFLPAAQILCEPTQPATTHELARLVLNEALPVRLHLWNQILLV